MSEQTGGMVELSRESAEAAFELLNRVALLNSMILISELLLGDEAFIPTDQLRRVLDRFGPDR